MYKDSNSNIVTAIKLYALPKTIFSQTDKLRVHKVTYNLGRAVYSKLIFVKKDWAPKMRHHY